MAIESIKMELPPFAISTGRRLLRDAASLLTQPGDFYSKLPGARNRSDHLAFIVFTAFIYSAAATMFTVSHKAVFLVVSLINSLLMPVVTAQVIHLVSRMFQPGRYTFGLLLGITAYANVALLLAWIPGFAPWAEIFKYILLGLGLAKTGGISGIKAFIIIIATLAILLSAIYIFKYIALL